MTYWRSNAIIMQTQGFHIALLDLLQKVVKHRFLLFIKVCLLIPMLVNKILYDGVSSRRPEAALSDYDVRSLVIH